MLVGGIVLATTFAWALAFSLIYSRPITRVAASEWIYQNIPGPINLHINSQDGMYNQPIAIPYGSTIQPGLPYQLTFTANASGALNEVYLAHVADTQVILPITLNASLVDPAISEQPLMASVITVVPSRLMPKHPMGI